MLNQRGRAVVLRAMAGRAGERHRRSRRGFLVAEPQDLDVLGCIGSGEQRQPAQYAGEQQIGESEGHDGRSSCDGLRTETRGRRRRSR
jgi:hypothetical protein